jgi:hypothetical protein
MTTINKLRIIVYSLLVVLIILVFILFDILDISLKRDQKQLQQKPISKFKSETPEGKLREISNKVIDR